jgi:hypothetical protein
VQQAARVKELYAKQAKEGHREGGKQGRQKQLGGDPVNLPEGQDAHDQAGKVAEQKTIDCA